MLPSARPAVLVVDDEPLLLSAVARRFSRAGYDVRTAPGGAEALAELERGWPALVILDLMMPRMDGFELCRRIKRLADLPIIVLSAVDASEAKVRALELYAEDYVTKPFDPDELVARAERVLRRLGPSNPTIRLGDVEIDLATRWLTSPTGTHQLTRTEARVLQVLAASVDRVVTTDQLLSRVWSESDGAEASYVWVTVRRLRRKLEPDPDHPRHLLTERGIGYRLTSDAAVPAGR